MEDVEHDLQEVNTDGEERKTQNENAEVFR